MPSVSTFGIEKERLHDLLHEAEGGRAQLPDFQRGWVWDDTHICSLLASVSLAYPIGTLMLLRTGGDGVRFRERPIEGATPGGARAERLVLDGQQRLTSLFQSLMLDKPVLTRDSRGAEVARWYYINIATALDPEKDREEAIVSVPLSKQQKDFRGNVILDLTTPEHEYESGYFPLTKVFDCFDWRVGYSDHWNHDSERLKTWNEFERTVVKRFEQYQVPVIELDRQTPKEAVCQVFEKVNTGGVTLTVFELLTAQFAADDYNLRDDWSGRREALATYRVLREVSATDFLQAVTLVASWGRRTRAIEGGDPNPPAIGARRADMLRLELPDYREWAPRIVEGLIEAAKFLHRQYLYDTRFLPYGSQLVPLSAILAVTGDRWSDPACLDKLARWFWCGVLGELYGGTTETRFARDLPDVLAWIEGGDEPRTVTEAAFAPARLRSLRRRNSAAYKGLYARLLSKGAMDLRTGAKPEMQVYFDEQIDIHHVFPQAWCKQRNVDMGVADSIINKTPLSARTNRMIGAAAPSIYVQRLVKSHDDDSAKVDRLLKTHLISPETLRADDFHAFVRAREAALLKEVEEAMGKPVQVGV